MHRGLRSVPAGARRVRDCASLPVLEKAKMFCDLPESLDPVGEGWDPEIVQEMRDSDLPRRPALKPEDRFEIANKGTNGQLQKMLGPRVVHSVKYLTPTADMKKIAEEVNIATRDCAFHFLETHGNNRVKRFRKNLEDSYGARSILGEKMAFCNWNPWAQLTVLIIRAYLKSNEVHFTAGDTAPEHQRLVARVPKKDASEPRLPPVSGSGPGAAEVPDPPRRRVRIRSPGVPEGPEAPGPGQPV